MFKVASSIRQALGGQILKDQRIVVSGHVERSRVYKDIVFLDLVDGSTSKPLQCILTKKLNIKVSNGSYLNCLGTLVPSPGPKQGVEFKIESVRYYGPCDRTEYPLTRQDYNLDQLRNLLHLRPRDPFFRSLTRVRSELLLSAHMIMKQMEFFQVDTPILTSIDSESNSDLFMAKRTKSLRSAFGLRPDQSDESDNETQINSTKNTASEEERLKREIKEDFFTNEIFLTCSAQLHLEVMASSLSKVYTISHSFRAENSMTRRHLCEFPMFEAEEADLTFLDPLMDRVETILKFMANYIMNVSEYNNDTHELMKKFDNSSDARKFLDKPFIRMRYDEAIKSLARKDVKLGYGQDISRANELVLLEYCDNLPIFITDYPDHLKPFYMKVDPVKKEANCFDLIAPTGGEICGGSLREDSYDALLKRISLVDSNPERSFGWYLDLRKFGTFPHGGFGVGIDRLVQTLIGLRNIKDANLFPRWSRHCSL